MLMNSQEIYRAIQYITSRTAYSREIVDQITRTGFSELSDLAQTSSQKYERDHLLEYICQWTISQTGHPETLVREIMECAGQWLDEMCKECLVPDEEPTEKAENQ